MKSLFDSKMSSSPFYVGPSIHVDSNSGWSFRKKEKSNYKILTLLLVVSIAVFLVVI